MAEPCIEVTRKEEAFVDAITDEAVAGVRARLGNMLNEADYERLGERVREVLVVQLEVVRR